MLTQRMAETLAFINRSIEATAVAPSMQEIADALNLSSKSGVHRLIISLEERGFIRRIPHRGRAIEVIKLPQAMKGAA